MKEESLRIGAHRFLKITTAQGTGVSMRGDKHRTTIFAILDDQNNVIPVESAQVALQDLPEVTKKLKQEKYKGYYISTVFLPCDLEGIHFETAIFPCNDKGYVVLEEIWHDRASTFESHEPSSDCN